jgi:hypothetical protein
MSNEGQSNRPASLVSLSNLTGRYDTGHDNIMIQPCSCNPNDCRKLGSATRTNAREYSCNLNRLHDGKTVICGQSALVCSD